MLLVSRVCQPALGLNGSQLVSAKQACELQVRVAFKPKRPGQQKDNLAVDYLACAFVSLAVLRKVGVISLSWVQVKSRNGGSMLLRLVESPTIDESDLCLYVNPLIAFNLKVNSKSVVEVKPRYLVENKPTVAGRVTIARVRSPDSSGHAEYGPALREFFKVPRLLRKLDIIAIPTTITMSLEGIGEGSDNEIDEEDKNAFGDATGFNSSDFVADEGAEAEPENTSSDLEDPFFEDVKILSDWDFDLDGESVEHPKKLTFFQVTELAADGDETSNTNSSDDLAFEGMIVDGVGGETMLAQAGAVNTRIPDKDVLLAYLLAEEKENVALSSQKDSTGTKQKIKGTPAQKELFNLLKIGANPRMLSVLKRFSVLIHGGRGAGKRHMVNNNAMKLGYHVFEASLTPIRGLPEDRAAKKLKAILNDGAQHAPCVIHLRNLQALAPLASGSSQPPEPEQVVQVLKSFSQPNVIIVASTSSVEDVPAVLRGCFTHEVSIPAPDKDARFAILEFLTANRVNLDDSVSLESLANRTAGRTAVELKALFANAACLLFKLEREKSEVKSGAGDLEDAWSSILTEQKGAGKDIKVPLVLTQEIIDCALEELPSAAAMAIGAPKIPQVYWKDVGGLGHAKEEILDMVQLPLEHPELFASGVRQRSGILLYGPPGTGKTLLAKAVATECNLNFISVKGPELLDMYIGESERKVRQVFETARSAKPCVLFFDELDSLAPQRGRGSDSGGVMDRVVSQLLTEIDGMQGNADVFVIGATNRPDLLDQSLLRPGRFDRLIYLGISRDRDAQLKIVKALSRKFVLDNDVDLHKVLERCPFNYTGADFYALCSGAMANALQRRVREIQDYIKSQSDSTLTARKYLSTLSEEDLQVTVKMCDYMDSLRNTIPSVSEDEIRHYESLRDKFSPSSSNKQNEEDEQFGLVEDLQSCPSCGLKFVKDGGCEDMTCPQCNTKFKCQ